MEMPNTPKLLDLELTLSQQFDLTVRENTIKNLAYNRSNFDDLKKIVISLDLQLSVKDTLIRKLLRGD